MGAAGAQRGTGPAADIRVPAAPDEWPEDRLGRIASPPEQRVPDMMRAVLDAYYRAQADRRATPGKGSGEPQ